MAVRERENFPRDPSRRLPEATEPQSQELQDIALPASQSWGVTEGGPEGGEGPLSALFTVPPHWPAQHTPLLTLLFHFPDPLFPLALCSALGTMLFTL